MLKVSGSVRMVRKAGMASSKRSHGMSLTAVIIKKPTTMRAGAVTGETNKGSSPPVGSGIGGDPRPALYIAGNRAGAHAAAEDGRQRIDQQNAPGLRHLAILIEELAFLGHGEHGPHGVEEIRHEEGEDHGQQRELQDLPHGEHPAPYGRGVEAEVHYPLGRRHDPEDHTHDARREDPDNDAASNAARDEYQRDYEPECGEQHGSLREVAQGHVGLGVGHDEAGVLQADKRDKQPYTDGDRELEREGDGVEHRLAQIRQHEQGDEQTLDHDHGHRLLPAESQAQDEGEGYYGVQA